MTKEQIDTLKSLFEMEHDRLDCLIEDGGINNFTYDKSLRELQSLKITLETKLNIKL